MAWVAVCTVNASILPPKEASMSSTCPWPNSGGDRWLLIASNFGQFWGWFCFVKKLIFLGAKLGPFQSARVCWKLFWNWCRIWCTHRMISIKSWFLGCFTHWKSVQLDFFPSQGHWINVFGSKWFGPHSLRPKSTISTQTTGTGKVQHTPKISTSQCLKHRKNQETNQGQFGDNRSCPLKNVNIFGRTRAGSLALTDARAAAVGMALSLSLNSASAA